MTEPIETSIQKVGVCPAPESLAAILSGQPVDQMLENHLETCATCQATLDRLSDDSFLNDLRNIGSDQNRHGPIGDTENKEAFDTRDSTLINQAHGLAHYLQAKTKSNDDDRIDPSLNMVGRMLGQYQIQRLLGQGGMGAVYEATDTTLNRNIALKLMRPDKATTNEYRLRFTREAQAAARVTHDNLCPIYQVGEADGLIFIAMPLLSGETLEQRMKRQPPTLAESMEIIRQSAEALYAAHEVGMVHRDIKPANIWLEPRPQNQFRVRILDFGLARFQSDDQSVTHTGTVLGTPHYMAPEQARGAVVDARADLFSLGAVFYELVTGNKPFAGDSVMGVLSNVLTHDPPSVSQLNSDIPESVSRIISGLLDKNRDTRTPEASALLQQLQSLPSELIEPAQNATLRKKQSELDTIQSAEKVQIATRKFFGFPPRVWGLVAVLLIFCFFAGVMLFQTPTGTLVVEFDDSVDMSLKNGALNIHNADGSLQYTLRPGQNVKELSTGTYHINVTGADGLQVDTDSFEMKRGEKVVVHVTATSSPNNSHPEPATAPTNSDKEALANVFFPGKILIDTDFSDPEHSKLQLGDFSNVHSSIQDGVYRCTLRATNLKEKLLLPVASRVDAAAFFIKCRSLNGNLFFNCCAINDGKRNRFISVSVKQGTWNVYHVERVLENGQWVTKRTDSLASENVVDSDLMEGKWIDIAAQWNKSDYTVWLNGKRVSSGPLPVVEIPDGRPQPIQVCVNGNGSPDATLELTELKLVDQTGLPIENTYPTGLPR